MQRYNSNEKTKKTTSIVNQIKVSTLWFVFNLDMDPLKIFWDCVRLKTPDTIWGLFFRDLNKMG